jgi:hypothetical protein
VSVRGQYKTRAAANLPEKDIAAVAAVYRTWHTFDNARSASAVRAELLQIQRVLSAAADCLRVDIPGKDGIAAENTASLAWRLIRTVRTEAPMSPPEAASELIGWSNAAKTAMAQVPSTRYLRVAPRIAAAHVLILRDRRGLKCSTTPGSGAAADLVKVAKDSRFKEQAASKVLKEMARAATGQKGLSALLFGLASIELTMELWDEIDTEKRANKSQT